MRFLNRIRGAALALVGIGSVACEDADRSELVEEGATDVTQDESVRAASDSILARLNSMGTWERAHHQPRIVSSQEFEPDIHKFTDVPEDNERLQQLAERDAAWYSEDGQRYEVLYLDENGVAYGRLGAAPWHDKAGAIPFPGEDSKETTSFGVGQLPQEAERGVRSVIGGLALPTTPNPVVIGTDSSYDNRQRSSSTIVLTSFPARAVGAMSGNGSTAAVGCSGAKIAPRAVLSASHCVMNSNGVFAVNGFFNPGQTNTTTPNGSIAWNGVFARDWRVHRRYDYSVFFLNDSSAVVSLGWFGADWGVDADWYDGLLVFNRGYPAGPNHPAGSVSVQTCSASPRSDKRCDGWMYTDVANLQSNAFMSDELLQFENDVSAGHSGSPVYSSAYYIFAVVTHGAVGQDGMGPRFRQSMWNDVCSWIGEKPSAFGDHACE